MPDPEPYTGPSKLVIAFDIGTTNSGVSYCHLKPGQVPEILGVTRFPAQESGRGDAKVPTLLYYDNNGNVKAAGSEVLAEHTIEDALTENWTKAEWWKLHLRPNHMASSINDDDLPKLPPGKSAVDVLTDFIRFLFNCAKTYILERHLAFPWSTLEDSIEYIFTHPNGWEGLQQQLYRQAIERAGLIPSTPKGHSRVHMLTEGEASLHFCVPILLDADNKHKRGGVPVFNDDSGAVHDPRGVVVIGPGGGTTNHPDADDQSDSRGVVIIDAGGGTVDLSMFSMTSDPVSCKEIAPAECRLQGSVFVTRRAKKLLQKNLEGWERSSEGDISEFTQEFDRKTKLVIKTDQEQVYVKVAGRRYSNQKYNITFGNLKLSGAEATNLFKDSIDAIVEAFEQQVKSTNVQITAACVVGGLSSNDWVWSQLKSYFEDRKIQVCRPDNQINKAVTHGAVLSYIDREKHLVASRVTRSSFGFFGSVMVNQNNEQHVRRRSQWELDGAGNRCIPGYFKSKLRKGTSVPEEMEFREALWSMERDPQDFRTLNVELACYRGNSLDPEWVDEDESSYSTLCTIHADASQAVDDLVRKRVFGRVSYRLDFELIVFFGRTELQAEIAWKTRNGERRIPATVTYAVPYDDFSSLTNSQF